MSAVRLISRDWEKSGIRIRTSQVHLSHKNILPVARMINEKLDEFDSGHENLTINIIDRKSGPV
ncbi:MAG: hypothetical protein JXA95_02210 [Spirochaetales bacterium]|nr:hypothetical protein [Spirochaetales bacterium]